MKLVDSQDTIKSYSKYFHALTLIIYPIILMITIITRMFDHYPNFMMTIIHDLLDK